jgi:hypothetical protein
VIARAKISSVELEPEQLRYVEKYNRTLQIAGTKQLPSKRLDYSSATIKLPTRIFCSLARHILQHPRPTSFPPKQPTWDALLSYYTNIIDKVPQVDRWQEIPIQTAAWYPKEGGSFAAEVPVTEVWRLMASYVREAIHTVIPGIVVHPETKLFVGDAALTVADNLQGNPVVRVEFMDHAKVKFAGYGLREICSEQLAAAMCGGLGLPPDRLYRSKAAGWDFVPLPEAFAFTNVSRDVQGTVCLFAEHYNWAYAQIGHMMGVCKHLWDHAESIDCIADGVPIKVLLEQFQELRTLGGNWLSFPNWKVMQLQEGVNDYFSTSGSTQEEDSVEIEDAIFLVQEASKYTKQDAAPWDEDGMNKIVDDWWGRFGADRARWIALELGLKIFGNVVDSVLLPDPFTALLHSPTGSCFVV